MRIFDIAYLTSEDQRYVICVLEYLEGVELLHLAPWQPVLLYDIGTWLALLRNAFQVGIPTILCQSNFNLKTTKNSYNDFLNRRCPFPRNSMLSHTGMKNGI